MTAPLVVLGVLSFAGGFALNPVHHGPFFEWLAPAVAPTDGVGFAEHGALTEPALIAISVVAAALGIVLAYLAYLRRDVSVGARAEVVRGPIAELMERKFFVDELYDTAFVRVGGRLADSAVWFDTNVIDGVVNASGAVSQSVARVTRRAQTGLARGYVASMVLGAVVVVAVLLIQVR